MYIYSRTGFAPRLRNRARGLAGAEAGGAMQAVVAGQSAQGIAGAECRGSLVSYARGCAGAEARGAPAIKALGFAGAEAGGTLEAAAPAYGNGFRNYLEFLLPAASIKASGILNCLLSIDDAFPELRTVANGGLVEHASGFDMQLELADGTVVPFARLAWDATTGRIVARPRFATLPTTGARCRLFFGKTVSVDGASEGGAYAAHLAAPNIRTGADRTGLGRGWSAVEAATAPWSSFIHVYPQAIDTAAPGDIIRPSFDAAHTNETSGLGDLTNKIVDWRGRIGSAHYNGADKDNNTIFRISGSNVKSSTIFCGGSTTETEAAYVNGTWKFTHGNDTYGENSPGLRFDVAPDGVECQGFDLVHCMDGVIPAPALSDTARPTLRNFRIINCHDDCIQNDGARQGRYYNGLMKGHVWFSVRPGGDPTLLSSHFEHCLIHMIRGRYDTDESGTDNGVAGSKRSGPYISPLQRNNTIVTGNNEGWAHKWFIKTAAVSAGVYKAKGSMKHCLLRIDTIPVEGVSNPGVFPTDWTYEDVTVCWLGPPANGTGYGPWPFSQSKATLAAMGITLIDDEQQAYDMWAGAEGAWYAANGWNGSTFSWNRYP